MVEIKELLERLEARECSSYLDAEIYIAFGIIKVNDIKDRRWYSYQERMGNWRTYLGIPLDKEQRPSCPFGLGNLTSSVDAVFALVKQIRPEMLPDILHEALSSLSVRGWRPETFISDLARECLILLIGYSEFVGMGE